MKWKVFSLVSVILFFLVAADFSTAANISTSVTTSESVLTLTQGDFRWYENINSLTPTTALAGENATTTTPDAGTTVRLRVNVLDEEVTLATGHTFNLQYANSTSGPWTDLSAATSWIFSDNSGVADGQIIADAVLSNSDIGESYSESNPTASTPNQVGVGQRGEWDWVIKNGSADTENDWFFRMVYSSSTALDSYTRYPQFVAQEAKGAPSTPPSTVSGGGGGGTGFFATTTRGLPPGLAVPPPFLPPRLQRADLNEDSSIDIIDLSILLYYYGQTGQGIGRFDFNKNDAVDFPDVSILMFYWTD